MTDNAVMIKVNDFEQRLLVNEMNRFLRNYTDATNEHKEAIKKRMSSITQEEIDFMEAITFRDKTKLSQLLANYPQISQKQRISMSFMQKVEKQSISLILYSVV